MSKCITHQIGQANNNARMLATRLEILKKYLDELKRLSATNKDIIDNLSDIKILTDAISNKCYTIQQQAVFAGLIENERNNSE